MEQQHTCCGYYIRNRRALWSIRRHDNDNIRTCIRLLCNSSEDSEPGACGAYGRAGTLRWRQYHTEQHNQRRHMEQQRSRHGRYPCPRLHRRCGCRYSEHILYSRRYGLCGNSYGNSQPCTICYRRLTERLRRQHVSTDYDLARRHMDIV